MITQGTAHYQMHGGRQMIAPAGCYTVAVCQWQLLLLLLLLLLIAV
jgi:hypothetical protein